MREGAGVMAWMVAYCRLLVWRRFEERPAHRQRRQICTRGGMLLENINEGYDYRHDSGEEVQSKESRCLGRVHSHGVHLLDVDNIGIS